MAPDGTVELAIATTGDPEIDAFLAFSSGTVEHRSEGSDRFILIEGLRFKARGVDQVQDALLCLNARDGYATRLYLTNQVPGVSANWQGPYYILSRSWHSWSWRDVPANQPPISILAGHLQAFR